MRLRIRDQNTAAKILCNVSNWVKSGNSAALPGTSAPEGKADEIGAKADIGARMSAIGGKAEVLGDPSELRERRDPTHGSPFGPQRGCWLSDQKAVVEAIEAIREIGLPRSGVEGQPAVRQARS